LLNAYDYYPLNTFRSFILYKVFISNMNKYSSRVYLCNTTIMIVAFPQKGTILVVRWIRVPSNWYIEITITIVVLKRKKEEVK
jgi:hypothetical protein